MILGPDFLWKTVFDSFNLREALFLMILHYVNSQSPIIFFTVSDFWPKIFSILYPLLEKSITHNAILVTFSSWRVPFLVSFQQCVNNFLLKTSPWFPIPCINISLEVSTLFCTSSAKMYGKNQNVCNRINKKQKLSFFPISKYFNGCEPCNTR